MSEKFVVDEVSLAELDKALAKLDEQKPKDRLEYTMFASRNYAAISEWVRALGTLTGDITISHRADEQILQANYLASLELNQTVIGLLKAYMTAVPTWPVDEDAKEKDLKSRIARWFS